jgi:FemAB-related protein (PEP-CTERM system-associated)
MRVERWAGPAGEWDAFVRRQPGWTPFHLAGWQDVMRDVFRHDTLYLAARGAAGLAGVLPLVLVTSPVFGRFLVSMPFVNYGGPLGSPEAVQTLAEEAVRLGREARVKLTEFRSRTEQAILLPASHRKVTVVLDLPPYDAPALFKGFDAKLRSQVRRPQKEGMTMHWGAGELGAFYDVFSRHMRDLGTPVLPRRFFESVAATFGDQVWIGATRLAGQPVAAGFGFRFGESEFEMTWASSLYAFNRLAPNMLLYWSFLERACGEGLPLFNFGRCTPGAGTHRFKRQWGSRDELLWWYQDARGRAHTPSPDDGAYAWGPRIWRKLPLRVANLLGPPVVAGIP